jgi:DNA-binding MarR family transcriptional regulator
MADRSSRSPAEDVSTLEAHLGYWLRFVSNHVSQAFNAKVAEREVTVAEWVILRELYAQDGSVAPSTLAASLRMTRGAISKLIDRLAAKTLVHKNRGEGGDRRFQEVGLTARGRRLVPRLAQLADENDAEFFGHLTARQRTQLEGTLKEIVRRRGLTEIPIE